MKRHSKKKDTVAALLKNKNVLYIVFFFAILSLFSYLMLKQLDAVAFFIIIGFLTTYFSKNMIIVLLTAMISTFLLVQIKLLGKRQEGMENATDASGNKIDATEDVSDDADDIANRGSTAPPDPVAGTAPIPNRAAVTAASNMKPTEKFTQQLNPARYNAADDDDVPRHKPKVDYSATLETAYDNLDKLLSSNAIKNMTEDTGRLAEKQKQLMGNIEKIQPVMEKAKGILESFDMGSISKLMENIGVGAKMLDKAEPPAA